MSLNRPERLASLQARRGLLIGDLLASKASGDGLQWCISHTELADEVVRSALASIDDDAMPELAIIATGGYGRSELAPYSDIDLTVVPMDEADPKVDGAIRRLFRALEDAFARFGLKVTPAYQIIADAPGLDAHTRTALLDARFVAGSAAPLERLLDQYWDTFPIGEFLIAKIEEREGQLRRYHETPLVVEPQLKEGAGGLRCFQCANWIGAAMGERPTRPNSPYREVLHMRNLLQAVAGRPVDLLTRPRQGEIAEQTGTDPLETGSRLAEAMLNLHRHYRHAVERVHESRFVVVDGVQALRGEARVDPSARLGSAALGIGIATRLGLRISELETKVSGEIDASEVLAVFSSGEDVLRNLDRCGLLAQILPELTDCRTLMPDDSAHNYTVFEHTFRAVRHLDSLRNSNGLLAELYVGIQDLGPLYLAALLHDAGKNSRGLPHSEEGERIAFEVGKRLGMARSVADTVAWLVRQHLEMARTIRMRDVHLPETVREFAALVQTKERLAMLTLLTWADVNAVSDSAWTPAQDAFLRDLYQQTLDVVQEAHLPSLDPGVFRRQVIKRLERAEIPEADLRQFVDSLPAHYLLSTAAELIREHFHFAQRARAGERTIELFERDDLQATDVTICCLDAPGLLSRVLGVFYALDLSPIGLRACTTESPGEQAVALDVFTVAFAGRPLPRATCAELVDSLDAVLSGAMNVGDLLQKRGKDPDRRQQILNHTFKPGSPGILEIRAPRGRGMAYRVSRLIADQGWNILAARVGQWAGQGAAAFYVSRPDQGQISAEEVRSILQD